MLPVWGDYIFKIIFEVVVGDIFTYQLILQWGIKKIDGEEGQRYKFQSVIVGLLVVTIDAHKMIFLRCTLQRVGETRIYKGGGKRIN